MVPGLKLKGDVIAGRYCVEKMIGVGSSGFVVAARHSYLRRFVTLKILSSTTRLHQKAQRKRLALAHAAAALRSPHVAKIVDTGFTEDGLPFIATERLEGMTLANALREKGKLPARDAVRLIIQACSGLAEAHEAGIVHGDLKPQNLFLVDTAKTAKTGTTSTPPKKPLLKILDFGMSAPLDGNVDGEEEDTSTAWFASPAYLAPEQIRDPHGVDARADVWALGVILHEMIAGELPFSSDTISGMLVAVAYDEPALLAAPDVPYDLARIVHRCLAKERDARIADVASLARELARFSSSDVDEAALAAATAAASTPPQMAMTMDSQNGVISLDSNLLVDDDVSAAPSYRQPVMAAAEEEEGAPPPPSSVDKIRRAIDRRRKGAIATVAAAAVVAFVSIFEEPPKSVPAKVARDLEPPLIPGERESGDRAATPPDEIAIARPTTEVRAFVPPSSATAIREVDGVHELPSLSTTLPPKKPGLAVRDNPYSRGFTHPTRLETAAPARRKTPFRF